jgi:regulator of replication initiation timing
VITHVSEKETRLAYLLREMTDALDRTTKERDALKANLHQVSLSHTHLHTENKVLRDALALAKDLTTIVRMPNVEYIADAHNKAVEKIQAALTRKQS